MDRRSRVSFLLLKPVLLQSLMARECVRLVVARGHQRVTTASAVPNRQQQGCVNGACVKKPEDPVVETKRRRERYRQPSALPIVFLPPCNDVRV